MTLARLLTIGTLLSGLFANVGQTRAQDDQYEQTIRRALAEYDAGNWEEARAQFRQAHGLNPNARTWRGMGISAFELRQYVNTIHELEAALADGRKPLTLDQRTDAQRLIAQARDYVSVYRLKLTPADAQILIDGAPAAAKDGKLYVDPGSHSLTFRAAGHQERRLDVRLDAGTQQELTVDLTPTPKPGEPVAQNGPAPKRKKWPWTWGFGAATLASGIVLGGFGLGVHRQLKFNNQCVDEDLQGCSEFHDKGMKYTKGVNVMFGVTGALAVSTIIAVIVESKKNSTELPTQTSLIIGPSSIAVRGTF